MKLETLFDCWVNSARLTMRCAAGNRDGMKSIRRCVHSVDLDVRTLVATRGKEFPLDMLASRLKCASCGSRRVVVSIVCPDNVTRIQAAG